MSLKSLMYYFVLFEADNSELFSVFNVYYRGISNGPASLTYTQVTLVLPLSIFIVLYIPTFIYIVLINYKNSWKNMNVTDIAVLFVFPLFTSLCFTKTTYKGKVKSNSHRAMLQDNKRSKSLPNLFSKDRPLKLIRRTKSAFNLAYRDKTNLTANFSLLHSNILYMMFVIGDSLVMGVDIAIQLHKHPFTWLNPFTYIFLIIFILNILLWINFNYNRRRHRVSRICRWVLKLRKLRKMCQTFYWLFAKLGLWNALHWWTLWAPARFYILATGAGDEDTHLW